MKQSLKLKLGPQLVITPQMRQAIRLLRLSTIELRSELRQLLESNYMLEMDDDLPREEWRGGAVRRRVLRRHPRPASEDHRGEEPGRPGSDQRLALDLERAGLRVARRTAAKYRASMGIPPSNERRQAGAVNLDISA